MGEQKKSLSSGFVAGCPGGILRRGKAYHTLTGKKGELKQKGCVSREEGDCSQEEKEAPTHHLPISGRLLLRLGEKKNREKKGPCNRT